MVAITVIGSRPLISALRSARAQRADIELRIPT
jgi:hypothetical protein